MREGTWRPARHGPRPVTDGSLALVAAATPESSVNDADRRRLLRGLSGDARRLAAALLATFDGWTPAALEVLRSYALSCERLRALEQQGASPELYRELRANLALLGALELEGE